MFVKTITRAALVASVAMLAAAPVSAQEAVKLGGLMEITGPIASLVPPIQKSVELAVKHVNDNGGVLNGRKIELVIADSQCNPQAAAPAAQKLVNVDRVVALVGPLCSGATISAANSAAIPAGVVIVSPSATSPAITTLKDNDFVFRTAGSDFIQGGVLAQYLLKRGIKRVALTFMNNDYGVGLAGAFRDAYKKGGGVIAGDQPHDEKSQSFRNELAALARGKAEHLVVIAYANSSGPTIVKQAIEGGFFKKFIGSEGTRDKTFYDAVGMKNLEGMIMSYSGEPTGEMLDKFNAELGKVGKDLVGKPYTPHAYDAAFMIALAIEKAGGTDRKKVRDALRQVGSFGGVKIGVGEWAKAKQAIKEKKKVFYAGAAGTHVFDKNGDVSGVVDIAEIKDGKEALLAKYQDGKELPMKK